MPIRRGNERTNGRTYERTQRGGLARATANKRSEKGRGGMDISPRAREEAADGEEAISRPGRWYLRPFTVLGHGSLQSQLRFEACCAMRRARNRGPRLIKRRRAIVNDTPRLVVKDRGISKRVTAVTPPRSIDRNRLRGRGQRGRYTHARTQARACYIKRV